MHLSSLTAFLSHCFSYSLPLFLSFSLPLSLSYSLPTFLSLSLFLSISVSMSPFLQLNQPHMSSNLWEPLLNPVEVPINQLFIFFQSFFYCHCAYPFMDLSTSYAVCLSFWLSVYLSVCPNGCICMSLCLKIHQSVYLSVCLPYCGYVCVCVCLPFQQFLTPGALR